MLTTATRVGFARHYDLTERVLPADVLAREVDEDEAVRELTLRAATALGVGTEADIRDYFRLAAGQVKPAIAKLVADGELERVDVDGWSAPAYLPAGQTIPRRDRGTALLCPFDPLIFFRPRVERLFGFHYRIEIYTPARKRQYGYYVWPFLLDGELVGRVDLKADRSADALHVVGAFVEPDRSAVAGGCGAGRRIGDDGRLAGIGWCEGGWTRRFGRRVARGFRSGVDVDLQIVWVDPPYRMRLAFHLCLQLGEVGSELEHRRLGGRVEPEVTEVVHQCASANIQDVVRVDEPLVDVQRFTWVLLIVFVDSRRLTVRPQLVVPHEAAQDLVLHRDQVQLGRQQPRQRAASDICGSHVYSARDAFIEFLKPGHHLSVAAYAASASRMR